MKKKVLILDLDNTIYSVKSIADDLFKDLFAFIKTNGEFEGDYGDVIHEIQRTPFQKVAIQFQFSRRLLNGCLQIYDNLVVPEAISYYEDYSFVRRLPVSKFLVTSGFEGLQNDKIDKLGIRGDFEDIYILDLRTSHLGKKEVFEQLIEHHALNKEELLIIGDDIKSEIKAGNELDIDVLLYDRMQKHPGSNEQRVISRFTELEKYI